MFVTTKAGETLGLSGENAKFVGQPPPGNRQFVVYQTVDGKARFDSIQSSDVGGGAGGVATIAALKALSVTNYTTGQQASVAGYYSSTDGMGGIFVYNSSSSATDNGGTVIQPTVGSGRWLRQTPTGYAEVGWFGATGDGSTDDTAAIQAAITWVGANGGGYVHFQFGTFKITSTLLISANGVRLIGASGDTLHDGGTGADAGSKIRWYGAASGIMAQFYTVSGGGNAKCNGMGASQLEFDGRATAGTGIKLLSVNACLFENVLAWDCTADNWLLTCYTAGTLAEASDTQLCIFDHCQARSIDTAPVQSANGWNLTSASVGAAGANTSFNTFRNCTVQVYSGIGFVLNDADNNQFFGVSVVRITTTNPGISVRGTTSDSNIFVGPSVSGATANGIRVQGTASGYTGNPFRCTFIQIDNSNGTQPVQLDAGCYCSQLIDSGINIQSIFNQVLVCDGNATPLTERANIGTESVRVYNASDNHVVLTDGTRSWGISIAAASGNLRLNRLAGSGTLTTSNGLAVTGAISATTSISATTTITATGQVFGQSLTATAGISSLNASSAFLDMAGGTVLRLAAVGANSSTQGTGKLTTLTSNASTITDVLTWTSTGVVSPFPFVVPSYTVAGLPATATYPYAFAFVTDATLTTITGLGLAPTGGGANKVPVFSDGAGWKML